MAGMGVNVTQGERWGLAFFLTVDDVAVPLAPPAMMEVRRGSARGSERIVRIDSDPAVGEGSIVEDGLPRGGLIIDLDTSGLETGDFYFDVWARRADDPETPRRLVWGTFSVSARVTDEISVDV